MNRINIQKSEGTYSTIDKIISKTKVIRKNLFNLEANQTGNQVKVETESRKILQKIFKRIN